MSYGKAYFRHSLITGAATAVTGVLFYVLRVALYGHLSPEEYGLFYALISVCMTVQPLFALGFDPGMAPFVTRMREQDDMAGIQALALNALLCQLGASLILAIPAAVFADVLAVHLFHAPQAAPLIRILALFMVLLQPFKTLMCVLLGLQFIGVRNLMDLVRVASTVALTLLLLMLGLGPAAAAWAYALAAAVGAVLGLLGLLWFCPPLRVWRPFRWAPDLLTRVFRSGKYMAVAFGGITVFSYMDTVMLTLLSNDLRAVAAYQLAAPTLMLLYSLIFAVASNFMPMVTTLWVRGEKDLLADGIGRIYEASIALLLPGGLILACFSDVLIRALFRGDILNAPDAFNILAAGSVFFFLCYLNIHILCGLGQARVASNAIVAGLAVNFGLNLALIPLFSLRGAATATVISYAIGAGMSLVRIRQELKVTISARSVVTVLFVACAATGVATGTRSSAAFSLYPQTTALISAFLLYGLTLVVLEITGAVRLRELARVALHGAPRAR